MVIEIITVDFLLLLFAQLCAKGITSLVQGCHHRAGCLAVTALVLAQLKTPISPPTPLTTGD